MVLGASVPSLGLSNKAVLVEEKRKAKDLTRGKGFADEVSPLNLVKLRGKELDHGHHWFIGSIEPPVEDDLLQNTLWPEVQKL